MSSIKNSTQVPQTKSYKFFDINTTWVSQIYSTVFHDFRKINSLVFHKLIQLELHKILIRFAIDYRTRDPEDYWALVKENNSNSK